MTGQQKGGEYKNRKNPAADGQLNPAGDNMTTGTTAGQSGPKK